MALPLISICTYVLGENEHVKITDSQLTSAPLTPSELMDRKTDTTIRFKGIPKRFIITDRWASGRYLDRSVPSTEKIKLRKVETFDSDIKN